MAAHSHPPVATTYLIEHSAVAVNDALGPLQARASFRSGAVAPPSPDILGPHPFLGPYLLHQALVHIRQHVLGEREAHLLEFARAIAGPLLREQTLVDEVLEDRRFGTVPDAKEVVETLRVRAMLVRKVRARPRLSLHRDAIVV